MSDDEAKTEKKPKKDKKDKKEKKEKKEKKAKKDKKDKKDEKSDPKKSKDDADEEEDEKEPITVPEECGIKEGLRVLYKTKKFWDVSFSVGTTVASDDATAAADEKKLVPAASASGDAKDSKSAAASEVADKKSAAAGEKRIFYAHRSILAARSPVFEAMFFSRFAESKDSKTVDVPDLDAESFEQLLSAIYTDEIDPPLNSDNIMNALHAAKKYSVETLRSQCVEFMSEGESRCHYLTVHRLYVCCYDQLKNRVML